MDKSIKVYRPKGIIGVLTYVLIVLLIAGTFSAFIIVMTGDEGDFGFDIRIVYAIMPICTIPALIMEIRLLIVVSWKKIVLDAEMIRIKKDKKGGFRVLQHEINLPYTAIHDIKLVYTATDTKGRGQVGLAKLMPNIYLDCNDGNINMINVDDYSKKQRIEIMNEIIKRARAVGNLEDVSSGEEIYNDCMVSM